VDGIIWVVFQYFVWRTKIKSTTPYRAFSTSGDERAQSSLAMDDNPAAAMVDFRWLQEHACENTIGEKGVLAAPAATAHSAAWDISLLFVHSFFSS